MCVVGAEGEGHEDEHDCDRSGFFYARNMNHFGGGIQRARNLHCFANIGLNPVLIVQLIRCLGRGIIQDILTCGLGEVRPVEYAGFLFCNPWNSFHRRLNTVQVLVGDLALEGGTLSARELSDRENDKATQDRDKRCLHSLMIAICHIDLRFLYHARAGMPCEKLFAAAQPGDLRSPLVSQFVRLRITDPKGCQSMLNDGPIC